MQWFVVLVVFAMTLMLPRAFRGSAYAEAGPSASCAGIGSSFAGAQTTRDDYQRGINAAAQAAGTPAGALVRSVARRHQASLNACFPPGTLPTPVPHP